MIPKIEIKTKTDKACEVYWLKVINRYKSEKQQIPDKTVTWYPEMGRIISLYTYSRYSSDALYEELADELLSDIFQKLDINSSVDVERNLSGLGCGLIYLLRNGFALGDEDEIVANIDKNLSMRCFSWKGDSPESLYGWIHYLWLRVCNKDSEDCTERVLINRQNLICYMDYLKFVDFSEVRAELIIDLENIHKSGLCPALTESLLSICRDGSVKESFYQGELVEGDQVTFLFPIRFDSLERHKNLDVCISLLASRKNTNVIVLEADTKSHYKMKSDYPNVDYYYVYDEDPVFYRTKYMNELLRKAQTPIIGIWDADVIVSEGQIKEAIAVIQRGEAGMCFAFDGRCYNLSSKDSALYRENESVSFLKECMKSFSSVVTNGVGGAFFLNRNTYLKAGGENERFYGWGVEDLERTRRMEILNIPVRRVTGPLFHLYHPRSENSGFHFNSLVMNNRKEFFKICRMKKIELIRYIQLFSRI